MKKYQWSRLSASLNLVGSLLLFFSFQATSTDFLLVTNPDGQSALCVGKAALFVLTLDRGLKMGTGCPEWQSGKPTAVVNTEHPKFAFWGLLMILVGFVSQYLGIERPLIETSRAEKRREKPKN